MTTQDVDTIWSLIQVPKRDFYQRAGALSGRRRVDYGIDLAQTNLKTTKDTQGFLDRLADCFARTKLSSKARHVTATAMVVDHSQKIMKIYITKNKGLANADDQTQQEELDEGAFAQHLCAWFSEVANTNAYASDSNPLNSLAFDRLIAFDRSRLRDYHRNFRNAFARGALISFQATCRQLFGVDFAIPTEVHDLHNAFPSGLIVECCFLAWKCRHSESFTAIRRSVEAAPLVASATGHGSLLKPTQEFVHMIDCLGRLPSAYHYFIHYCRGIASGYTFHPILLPSCSRESSMDSISTVSGGMRMRHADSQSRFLHRELQLLHYFSCPGTERCEDYFGCSKRSCWLCWQVLSCFKDYNTKGTHQRIYERWAAPGEYDRPLSPRLVRALSFTNFRLRSVFQVNDLFLSDSQLTALRQTSARLTGEWPGTDGLRRQSAHEWSLAHVDVDSSKWQVIGQVRAMVFSSGSVEMQRRQFIVYSATSAATTAEADHVHHILKTPALQQNADLYLTFQLPDWSRNQQIWNYVAFPCMRDPYDGFALLLWFNSASNGVINSFVADQCSHVASDASLLKGDVVITLAIPQVDQGRTSMLIDSDGPADEDLSKLKQRLCHMSLDELRSKAVFAKIGEGHGVSFSPNNV